MDLEELAQNYQDAFPDYPPIVHKKGWLYGTWLMGNNYKGNGYYGSYPPSYLRRVMSIFKGETSILHLFSGSLPPETLGDRFDINKDLRPDVVGNAEELSRFVDKKYNLVLADPPYSKEDAKKYHYDMPNRKKVLHECYKVLNDNGFVVWLDTVFPMYRKSEFKLIGTIGVIRSTNHRVRTVFIFQRNGESDEY